MKLTFLDAALDDIAVLTERLAAVQPQSARKFYRNLRKVFDLIQASPLIGAVLRGRPKSKTALRFVNVPS